MINIFFIFIYLFDDTGYLVIWLFDNRMSGVGCRVSDVLFISDFRFVILLPRRTPEARDVALLRLRFFRRCGATSLQLSTQVTEPVEVQLSTFNSFALSTLPLRLLSLSKCPLSTKNSHFPPGTRS